MNINDANLKKILIRARGKNEYSKTELLEFSGIIKAATDFLEDGLMRELNNDKTFWERENEAHPRKLEPKIRIDQTTKLMDLIVEFSYKKQKGLK